MDQAYKIDRLTLITYKSSKKKTVKSIACRYLAKSHLVKCLAQLQQFKFVNFRGSWFTKTNFKNSIFNGCDFWGTSFKDCSFQEVQFIDCVFMACKFKNCNFTDAKLLNSTIVNTSLAECYNINISGVKIYNVYPSCEISGDLEMALQKLKENMYLKKNKLLFISNTKYNYLNVFLLQRTFGDQLPKLLYELDVISTEKITTYKKLEEVLNKLLTRAII